MVLFRVLRVILKPSSNFPPFMPTGYRQVAKLTPAKWLVNAQILPAAFLAGKSSTSTSHLRVLTAFGWS